ncbi:PREDICTED: thioredoxin domain-containing protein 2-like [Tarenaya hassleriana]|uniref:thioredoxin domain-containing protein 2-like n=1 Tax=Tarenaya hassleriana TaxID=28532 RepID=UPI00053CAA6A|nr:PREDICTED: thioredoxin domain-containing protein 2-like [Tarenaya hassleriana]
MFDPAAPKESVQQSKRPMRKRKKAVKSPYTAFGSTDPPSKKQRTKRETKGRKGRKGKRGKKGKKDHVESDPKDSVPPIDDDEVHVESDPKDSAPKDHATQIDDVIHQEVDPKESEPEKSESKESEPKESEPEKSEPKESEPKESEPEKSEPKESDPKDPAIPLDGDVPVQSTVVESEIPTGQRKRPVYVWIPREPIIMDNIVRAESFVETTTRKANALFKFMQKPREERFWISRLNHVRKSRFFEDFLQEGVWLKDNHIDEAMHEIRKRVKKFSPCHRKYFLCDVRCCEYFKWWEMGQKEIGGVGQYMSGDLPLDGGSRKLEHYKGFISVLNIPSLANPNIGVHWVTVKVDFTRTVIEVYDCNPNMKEATVKVIHHLSRSIPDAFRVSGTGRIDVSNKFSIDFVSGIPQNETGSECGVYSIKYAEALYMGEPKLLEEVNDEVIYFIREKLACDIFANGQEVTVSPEERQDSSS